MIRMAALMALGAVIAGMQGGSPKGFYDFTVKDIDGKDVKLDKYKGQVCLIVNMASK